MSFSFNPDLSTDLDKVRFHVGDIVDSGHKVEDETITALLVLNPNPVQTSIIILRSLAAKYAGMADQSIGQVSVSYSQLSTQYNNQAKELKTQLAIGGGIYVGGLSEAEKDLDSEDDDLIQSKFDRDTITDG